MNQETSGKMAPQSKNGPKIPIQPGLFEYPVPKGSVPSLLVNRCTACAKTFFPKRSLCPDCCGSGSLEDITLSGRGLIYVVTVVHVPSPVGISAPYAYAYVDIPADGLRVFTLFSAENPDSIAPSLEVELVIYPIRVDKDGNQRWRKPAGGA
jgi:hypothetical protein